MVKLLFLSLNTVAVAKKSYCGGKGFNGCMEKPFACLH